MAAGGDASYVVPSALMIWTRYRPNFYIRRNIFLSVSDLDMTEILDIYLGNE